ncbi:MAG: GspD family T2SS secretin variant XcpQ [Candidatus Abyssubacteria bacterium]
MNDEISINFDNAPILEVIDVMSRVTSRNFILDPAVKGNVTVIAPRRVPKDEAYGVFESILELNGFSLVDMGKVIKVVPSRTATQKSIPVKAGRESAAVREQDHVVTQLIPIKYTDAQMIVTVLTPLISRDANITAYVNTNTVILTEVASNVKRLLKIVEEIDIPGFEETITIIPLTNAQADVLAQEILQALEPSTAGAAQGLPITRTRRRTAAQAAPIGAPASQIKLIPDLRTNSLIVVANEYDTEQVKFLVRELDKETPVEANNIHVYRLQNALADDVAAVLTSLATTAAPAAGAQGAAGAAPTAGVRTFYKEVSVVADKTTNSLIVVATPQDYAVISRVIEQLDIMRPQVLVETLIADVSLDFTRNLGIRWQIAGGGEDPAFITVREESESGSISGGIASSLAGADTVEDVVNIVPTITPAGISIGYLNIDADVLRAFVELNAAEDDSDFNVLSAPHILTLDNETAIINVSESVPFITSQLTDTGATDLAQSQTFEFRDVGIILEITPHISPERMVRLEIKQEVNQVSDRTTAGVDVLTEVKREAETTLMVKDGHTLVLGGLMQDTDSVSVSKVPFLGDIPILGWAFKNRSDTRRKTNLLIFITPRIVTNIAEANEVTIEKRGVATERMLEQMETSPTFRKSKTFGDNAMLMDDLQEAGPKW